MMKIQTGRGNIRLSVLIAIYSISMVTSLPGLAISPILGKLESIFPDSSELQLQMLESLPSFIIVPFILLAGRLSLRINKKRLLIIGLSIFFLSGVLYPFAESMKYLLWVSAFLGIGAGLVIPFSTGIVADYFTGNYRTRQLGYVSAITNLTLVLATLLSGFLAGISWHLSFLVYALSGVSLYFSFFLGRKPPYSQSSGMPAETTKQRLKLKWPVDLMLLYYLITFLALTIPLNLALYLQNLHLGNYNIAGTLISVFFLSMTLPGIFLNYVLRRLKGYTNLTALIAVSAGLFLFAIKGGLFFLILGVILIGLGYGTMQPIIYDKTAARVPPRQATYALSLVMVMNYIAIVTYPFIMEGYERLLRTDSAYSPFILALVISCIFTVFAFFRRRTKALNAPQHTSE